MTIDEESTGRDENSENGSIRTQQSQEQRRGNRSIAQSVQMLTSANESLAKTLAAAFREPA